MKYCVKAAFRLSFQHAEDSSAEGPEFISQAWPGQMEDDSKFCGGLFHAFSAMRGIAIE
jgi:hypothetical protein